MLAGFSAVVSIIITLFQRYLEVNSLQCISCGEGIYNINSENFKNLTSCDDPNYIAQNLNQTSFYCEGVCFTLITKNNNAGSSSGSKTLSCREQPTQLKSSVTKQKYCRKDQLYLVCENQDNCNLEHFVYQPNPVFDVEINSNCSEAEIIFSSDCQTHDYFINLNNTEFFQLKKSDLQ